ncbi:2-hydroxyacid dehydrogenase [Pontibacter oryzae]|uniref:2-hydroxyacid dehydrogenase n=1 Tax=Pontibacter oryzae TaxID=2304593 RepID=A0A399SFA3_9BACT|nr:2-hydroxyacid dehydrogenase [Pontibacter oryzae]RIJ42310.1 2-hydroxyacid dehydrogenase [Pontibacter oryzae]
MKITLFSSKPYDQQFFEEANTSFNNEIVFQEVALNENTAAMATGAKAICVFVNDQVNANVLQHLQGIGVQLVALRCAGYNNVDLKKAAACGIKIVRVPAYSPYAVAEHTIALILTLNRKTHRAYNRVKEGNFSLQGLLGFDLHGKTVGLIGLGEIGKVTAKILVGMGCKVQAYDPYITQESGVAGVTFIDLDTLYEGSDIISLHCPLTPETHHIINAESIAKMKKGVMLINTSRGATLETKAVIKALKTGKIKYLGLDVYEEEAELFFEDLSDKVIQDDVFMRLLSFNNVLITGHQAFFTAEAMKNIATTTLQNIHDFEQGQRLQNELLPT